MSGLSVLHRSLQRYGPTRHELAPETLQQAFQKSWPCLGAWFHELRELAPRSPCALSNSQALTPNAMDHGNLSQHTFGESQHASSGDHSLELSSWPPKGSGALNTSLQASQYVLQHDGHRNLFSANTWCIELVMGLIVVKLLFCQHVVMPLNLRPLLQAHSPRSSKHRLLMMSHKQAPHTLTC